MARKSLQLRTRRPLSQGWLVVNMTNLDKSKWDGGANTPSWFNTPEISLNGSPPSWISQYNNNRYALSSADVAQNVANTFTRATTASVTDFEGLVRTAAINEMRLSGLRRVENAGVKVYDSWNTQNAATISDNGDGSASVFLDTVNGAGVFSTGIQASAFYKIGGVWAIQIQIKAATAGIVRFREPNHGNSGFAYTECNVTTEWQTFTITGAPLTANAKIGVFITYLTGGLTNIIIRKPMTEDISGQANQNPASFVDGVEYLTYENGNTVASSIITEAQGADISAATRLGFLSEKSSTNLEPNSEDGLSSVVTVALGDNIISMTGAGSVTVTAGTAVGTGGGVATEGSPIGINVTTAGTINLTVSGSVDTKQVEVGTVPTSYISTSGSAVTRALDSPLASLSAVYNDDEGVIYFEGRIPALSTTKRQDLFRFDANGSADFIRIERESSNNTLRLLVKSAGVTQADYDIDTSLVAGEFIKVAFSYKLNEAIVSYNGTVVYTDTSFTPPAGIVRFEVASGNNSTESLNEHVSDMRYYNKDATNAELNRITTL